MDHRRTLYLLPFILGPCTVAEAAQHRGLKPNQMAYWVGRFADAGVLEVVGEAPPGLGGHPRGSLYRAVAREFVMLPAGGYAADEIVERQYGPMWALLKKAIAQDTDVVASRWAIKIMVHQERTIVQQEVPVECLDTGALVPEGNALNLWMTVRFDPVTLAELRAELEDVFNRYAARTARDRPDLPRTIMHLALTEKVD